jgi:hypothetical protein
MGRRFLLTVAVALGTCTVTACGGGSASGPSSSSSLSAPTAAPSASASTDATTAAYRHLLEQANVLFNSDVGSYDFNNSLKNLSTSCNLGQAPFTDSCRQWVLMDKALANQIVGLLSNAQVPPADVSNDQLLRQGLQMVIADDTAAANAIGSGDDHAVTSALGKLQQDSCTAVSRVLSKLDPRISSTC